MVSLEHNFNCRQNYVKQKTSQKRILVIDDDPDITLTFKLGLERNNDDDNKSRFEVYTCNNPLVALSNFKPNFFDLMLVDINMSPYMDGFEFCEKILQLDVNVRICFISAGEVNYAAIREIYPVLNIGCFIQKLVTIDYLIKILKAELD